MKLNTQLTLALLSLPLFVACSHTRPMETAKNPKVMSAEEQAIFVDRAIAGEEELFLPAIMKALGSEGKAALLAEGQDFLGKTDLILSEENIGDAFRREDEIKFLEKFRAKYPGYFAKGAAMKDVSKRLDDEIAARGTTNLDANSTITAGPGIKVDQVVVNLRRARKVSPKTAHYAYNVYVKSGNQIVLLDHTNCTEISKFKAAAMTNTEDAFGNISNMYDENQVLATCSAAYQVEAIANKFLQSTAAKTWSDPITTAEKVATHCSLPMAGSTINPFYEKIAAGGKNYSFNYASCK